MAMRRGWPIAVVPVGELSTGSVVFKTQGKLHGLVVVKATFRLRPGQLAELAPAEPVRPDDQHQERSPLRSLRAPSDLALFREQCDVWLVGHCYAPAGQSVQVATTRLALYRERNALLDKRLHVWGDRTSPDAAAAPFQRLAVEYERAFGGIGVVENPVGVGAKAGDRQPNILYPDDPRRPAGYGPLARYWRARKFALSDEARAALDQRIVEIPEPFDWGYFQCAPSDQRCSPLRGDEWLLLEGLHPAAPRLQCGLPAVHAEARLWSRAAGPAHAGLPIPLVADDLGIDVDAQQFTVCWRGSFPLPSLEMLSSIWVGAGLVVRGQPIDWAPAWARAETVVPDLAGLVDGGREKPASQLAQTAYASPDDLAAQLAAAAPLPFAARGRGGAQDAGGHAEEQKRAGPALPWERAPAPSPPRTATPSAPVARPVEASPPFAPPPDEQLPEVAPAFAPPPEGSPAAIPFALPSLRTDGTMPPPAFPGGAATAPLPFAPPARLPATPPGAARGTAAMPVFPGPDAAPEKPLPFQTVRVAAPSLLRRSDGLPLARTESIELERGNTVPTLADCPLQVVTLEWSLKPPTPSLTIIVKGTFALVPDAPAELGEESELPTGDIHVDDDLARSVRYASDFAVFKPRADVTVVGTAYAPGGRSTAMEAGFRLGEGPKALSRRMAVLGDRQWVGFPSSMSAPAPFEAMPLTWERAYGGAGHERNPAGVGHGAQKDAAGVARLPNLERPESLIKGPGDRPRPACFAPIPELWRPRWSTLGTYDGAWLRSRWPYFPDDFDYAYFQAAPEEQRTDYLRGDEPFEIWGLRPGAQKLEGALPGLRVRCIAADTASAGGKRREVTLALDTCAFDLDAMKLHLVWRGLLEVSAEGAPELEAIFVTAEPLGGEPSSADAIEERYGLAKWRATHPDEVVDEAAGAANDDDADDELGLELIRAEQQRAEALRRAIPFGGAALAPQPMPLPASPTPENVSEQLRRAGASESDIAAAVAALRMPLPDADTRRPEGAALRSLLGQLVAEGKSLAEIDLSAADLTGADLAGADLRDAVLFETKLAGAKLAGANLTGAQLGRVDLRGASLEGAVLDRADLTDALLEDVVARSVSLDETVLAEVKAARADFAGARGVGPSFEAADLGGARFDGAELDGADFSNAVLDGASFERATLPSIRLYDAHGERVCLRGAALDGARADGVKLPRATMENASAPDSVWEGADFDHAVMTRANLTGSSLVRANCEGAQLSGCELREGRLKGANLKNAQLVIANLMQASLEGADLSRADLSGANLHGAELWKAKLGGAVLEQAIVTGTKLEG